MPYLDNLQEITPALKNRLRKIHFSSLSKMPTKLAVTESEDDELNDHMDIADVTELVSQIDLMKSSDSKINKALMKVRTVLEKIKARLESLDTSDDEQPFSTMPQAAHQV